MDSLKIALVELFIGIDDASFAARKLKTVKQKSHINYKLVYAKILRLKGEALLAYQVLKEIYRNDPVNLSVMSPLIKSCVDCNKYDEAKNYCLEFLEIKKFDNQIVSIYLNILSLELGTEKTPLIFIRNHLFTLLRSSNNKDPIVAYLLGELYRKLALKLLNRKEAKDRLAMLELAMRHIKNALKFLPSSDDYLPVRKEYHQIMTEISYSIGSDVNNQIET